jgi:hypothetical protein
VGVRVCVRLESGRAGLRAPRGWALGSACGARACARVPCARAHANLHTRARRGTAYLSGPSAVMVTTTSPTARVGLAWRGVVCTPSCECTPSYECTHLLRVQDYTRVYMSHSREISQAVHTQSHTTTSRTVVASYSQLFSHYLHTIFARSHTIRTAAHYSHVVALYSHCRT